jgi:hypothetical protein
LQPHAGTIKSLVVGATALLHSFQAIFLAKNTSLPYCDTKAAGSWLSLMQHLLAVHTCRLVKQSRVHKVETNAMVLSFLKQRNPHTMVFFFVSSAAMYVTRTCGVDGSL